jgi:hypothetical protein
MRVNIISWGVVFVEQQQQPAMIETKIDMFELLLMSVN